ncbi:MAG: DnaB-like helicase N-terminal domain-containing protein, partial [Chitinivibrionales bacterium]
MAVTAAENNDSRRVPPRALDIEESVLGSMLIDGNALDSGIENLSPDSFYSTANREIFKIVRYM